jgi:NADPH:quinone reductase-like Zn-dependent oxidoreductase
VRKVIALARGCARTQDTVVGMKAIGCCEVRVRVSVSGVNPTDWKQRRGGLAFPEVVANQDGSGTVDPVGPGVPVVPLDRAAEAHAAVEAGAVGKVLVDIG